MASSWGRMRNSEPIPATSHGKGRVVAERDPAKERIGAVKQAAADAQQQALGRHRQGPAQQPCHAAAAEEGDDKG